MPRIYSLHITNEQFDRLSEAYPNMTVRDAVIAAINADIEAHRAEKALIQQGISIGSPEHRSEATVIEWQAARAKERQKQMRDDIFSGVTFPSNVGTEQS